MACGIIAKHQIRETIVQGTAAALFEAVRFENGRITNPHCSQYRVTRLRDVPDIQVVVLDRKDLPPPGAGETPIVRLAPGAGWRA